MGRLEGLEVAGQGPAALVVDGQDPTGPRRCAGRGGGTASAGGGEQPGGGENRNRGEASHSGSPSLSVTAGRVTSAPWTPPSPPRPRRARPRRSTGHRPGIG